MAYQKKRVPTFSLRLTISHSQKLQGYHRGDLQLNKNNFRFPEQQILLFFRLLVCVCVVAVPKKLVINHTDSTVQNWTSYYVA